VDQASFRPSLEVNPMALSEARKRANAKYDAKAYDKTLIRLPKGRLEEVRSYAAAHGESINGFIGRAIREAMERGAQLLQADSEAAGSSQKP